MDVNHPMKAGSRNRTEAGAWESGHTAKPTQDQKRQDPGIAADAASLPSPRGAVQHKPLKCADTSCGYSCGWIVAINWGRLLSPTQQQNRSLHQDPGRRCLQLPTTAAAEAEEFEQACNDVDSAP